MMSYRLGLAVRSNDSPTVDSTAGTAPANRLTAPSGTTNHQWWQALNSMALTTMSSSKSDFLTMRTNPRPIKRSLAATMAEQQP